MCLIDFNVMYRTFSTFTVVLDYMAGELQTGVNSLLDS